MKKLMIAGVTAVAMVAGGIGGAFFYKEHFEKARPYKLGDIEPPNMNKASREYVASFPSPTEFCLGDFLLRYDDLSEAITAARVSAKVCREAKTAKSPESDGACYVSEVMERHVLQNIDCALTVMERETVFKTGDAQEIEEALGQLKRYTEDRQSH